MQASDRPEPFGPVPPLTASYWLTCRAADSVIEAGLQLRHEAMLGRRWQRYAEALEVALASTEARAAEAERERDAEAAAADNLRGLLDSAEGERDAHRAESNWLRGLLDEAEARAARAGHMADLLASMYGQALAALVRCRGGVR